MLPKLLSRARSVALPVLVLGAAALVARARFLSPVPALRLVVDRGEVVEEAFGRGTIESQREATVGFDLAGRLSEVLVDEGVRVSLGQAMARLETSQAEADLRFAQTNIAAARSSLARLAADEQRARTQLAGAERDRARVAGLTDSGALPEQQRDDASDRARLARTELDRVLAQRSEATRSIDVAAGGAEQRRVTMVRATLLAPFDGLVTRRLREPGDTVTIGSAVFRIVDTKQVYASASLDESVLGRLAVDQRAKLQLFGQPAFVPARVLRVPWEADRQTHEILVDVSPERFEQRVAMGQRVDVRVELARRDGVLRVPAHALGRDEGGAFLQVDSAGKIRTIRPRLGLVGAEYVELLDGVAEGNAALVPPRGSKLAKLPDGRRWGTP